MNQVEELAYEEKMDRICELFEQIAMDAVIAALEKIIKRNELFELQKNKKQCSEHYRF